MTRAAAPKASVSERGVQSRTDNHSLGGTEHETAEDGQERHAVAVDVQSHCVDDVEGGCAAEVARHCAMTAMEEADLEAWMGHPIHSRIPPTQAAAVVRTVVRAAIAKLIAVPRAESIATSRAPPLPLPRFVSSSGISGTDKKPVEQVLCLCSTSGAPVLKLQEVHRPSDDQHIH
jgi:hypothetical protein